MLVVALLWQIWLNQNMTVPYLAIDIPEGERTPLVNRLLNLIAQQQQLLEGQQEIRAKREKEVTKLREKAASIEEQLRAAKKLKGKPKIRPSTLNQDKKKPKPFGKGPGSSLGSKKTDFFVDQQRIIEPEGLAQRATFNGYRE